MKPYDWTAPQDSRQAWRFRHDVAINGDTNPVAMGLRAWCDYAERHEGLFERGIGTDAVLGPAWSAWGGALLTLLDGDLGNLDRATLDRIIRDNLKEQGFDPEDM